MVVHHSADVAWTGDYHRLELSDHTTDPWLLPNIRTSQSVLIQGSDNESYVESILCVMGSLHLRDRSVI